MLEKLVKLSLIGLAGLLSSCRIDVNVSVPCEAYIIRDTTAVKPDSLVKRDTLYRWKASEESCPKYK